MTLDQCWAVSATWYAGRLDLDWQRPPVQRYQALLREHGLVDPFWEIVPAG